MEATVKLDSAKLKEMYTTMVRIRAFEGGLISSWRERKALMTPRYTGGTEGVAVGVCCVLEPRDHLFTSHRAYAPMIAKGARLDRLLAEAFGKETGYCKGRGGATHLAIRELNIQGAVPVVGSGVPIAAGVGLGCKLQHLDSVCVCFIGDGATGTGAFHEGLGLAAVWDLPLILVIQNNQYANSTPVSKMTKLKKLSDRAKAHGIPGVTVDGNDVIAVAEATMKAAKRARAGKGPTVLEASTYTTSGGSTNAAGVRWRSKEEVDSWIARNPIDRLRAKLVADKAMTDAEAEKIAANAAKEVEEAIRFADSSPKPDPADLFKGLYYEGQ
jgi:TPP-dependent pyruvate/acetoin dehydrogenase alpha subunit